MGQDRLSTAAVTINPQISRDLYKTSLFFILIVCPIQVISRNLIVVGLRRFRLITACIITAAGKRNVVNHILTLKASTQKYHSNTVSLTKASHTALPDFKRGREV